MAGQTATGWARPGRISPGVAGPSEFALRLVSALLALAVAGVHVADQGGITAFNSPPDYLGWAFRVVEVGGLLTALLLLMPWSGLLGWAAGALLGVGPLLSYLISRSIGIPGDRADIGNWGYWVGTLSLIIEAALVTLSVGMLLPWAKSVAADVRSRRPARADEPSQRPDVRQRSGVSPE
jgi:hypothetical protein